MGRSDRNEISDKELRLPVEQHREQFKTMDKPE